MRRRLDSVKVDAAVRRAISAARGWFQEPGDGRTGVDTAAAACGEGLGAGEGEEV